MADTVWHDDKPAGSILGMSVTGVLCAVGALAIANMGRKLAVQAPTALSEDWCAGLAKEHTATLAVFDKLEEVSSGAPAQADRALLANLKHMLTKHAMQEEHVIYPALRAHNGDGAADALNRDHGSIKSFLYDLGQMDKADPAFQTKLGIFREELEIHMREEEDTLFPELRDRLSKEENRKLTREMNMAGLMLA